MKLKKKIYGEVVSGHLKIDNILDWSALLHSMEGKQVTVKVEKRKKARSLNQNSYFHFLCEILGDELGYSKDEMKGIIKYQFKIPHTSDLSTVEFEELMSKIRTWASVEFGCYLPAPNESLNFIY